jgi:hypothetical protein
MQVGGMSTDGLDNAMISIHRSCSLLGRKEQEPESHRNLVWWRVKKENGKKHK